MWKRVLLGLSLFSVALVAASESADTVLFNYSPAYDCYRATLRDDPSPDTEQCDLAIDKQALDSESLAATYSNRGILLARSGDLAAALADHDRALSLSTHHSSLYINRANALVRVRRFKDAMDDLDRAVAIADGALAAAHYNRSLLFHRLGDLPSARSEAEAAAKLSPESTAYRSFLESLSAESGS